ncbi:AraC family transcriptional regulator [Paraburkholderia sp. SIMBA_050]|nr:MULTISPECIES: AraC family transcriptional regulator [Paraburkholderia]
MPRGRSSRSFERARCFNSASDFSRAFRRAYDMSPSDFRHLTR